LVEFQVFEQKWQVGKVDKAQTFLLPITLFFEDDLEVPKIQKITNHVSH